MKKGLLVVVILVLLVSFFALDLHNLFTLAEVKNQVERWQASVAAAPVVSSLIYLLGYVLVTALSLPGAVLMTLAGGALFGFGWGLLLISFASTLGATLAFLTARFLFADWVEQRFGRRLETLNRGIEKEGAFYLFTLRLVPIVPFFLINLGMGLTRIRVWTFYWVSQVGMLAGTAVYVNAGTQLAQLDSLQGIVSPSLLLSFALLGVFPLIANKLITVLKQRQVYAGYSRPKQFDRNLIVIGGGAGGLVSAYIGAAVKAKVTLVEANKMGGDCLNYGCVPSKALIKSAKIAQQMREAHHYGVLSEAPSISFPKVMARVEQVIKDIEPHDSVERYTKLGVDVVQGYAKLIDPWTVEIKRHDGAVQRLTSRAIVLATGASPAVPEIPGLAESGYLTTDTLWQTMATRETVPAHLVILGGGPIGCELAQAFARLGSQVTLIERSAHVLAREDEDVAAIAHASLDANGVTILTHTQVNAVENQAGQKGLQLMTSYGEQTLLCDDLLVAVGRTPRLTGFGLEELGLSVEQKLVTDDYLATLMPHIYAVGDVVGSYQFTHVAAHQAWYAAVNALFGFAKKFKVDYRVIPRATFLDPEIARVGLSEKEAQAQSIPYEVTRYGIDDLDRAIADGQAQGFVKVLTVPGKDTILGVTIVGEHGSDSLAEFVLAMKHGLGLNKILGTIHAYPTWAEANKYAAGEWKKAHAPERVLAWLASFHDWRRN